VHSAQVAFDRRKVQVCRRRGPARCKNVMLVLPRGRHLTVLRQAPVRPAAAPTALAASSTEYAARRAVVVRARTLRPRARVAASERYNTRARATRHTSMRWSTVPSAQCSGFLRHEESEREEGHGDIVGHARSHMRVEVRKASSTHAHAISAASRGGSIREEHARAHHAVYLSRATVSALWRASGRRPRLCCVLLRPRICFACLRSR
jgi:hypothetical protein